MKHIHADKIEKIKQIALIIFCILIASGSFKNYTLDRNSSNEIIIDVQNEQDNLPKEQSNLTEEKNQAEEGNVVNINEANSEQLQTLSGIGPTKAESIIQYRNDYGGFTAIQEITQVKGIGDATFLKIKDFITIQ